MNILLIFLGFIIAFIIVFYYEYKIRQFKAESRNRVHFYVTCELNHHGKILRTLWLGKPYYKQGKGFVPNIRSSILSTNLFLRPYNLNYSDFEDMKNGEIREVFLNMED